MLRQDFDGVRESNFSNSESGQGCELIAGSMSGQPSLAIAQTIALRSGATFSLRNANGSLDVSAPSATTRVLRWHNTRTGVIPFDLDTRPQEMTVELAGGVMEAGAAGSDACRRLSGESPYTVTYQEGAVDFASVDDFRAWMKWGDHGPLYLDDTYDGSGMLGGFRVGQSYSGRPLLAVDLVRICIAGKPASNLPGANDAKVRVEGSEPPVAWACPGGAFDVAAEYRDSQRHHELDTTRERRLRTYLGI